MSNYKQLRNFIPEDLLFNEEESRTVLKFIFKSTDHELIDSLPITDYLREFAQGLLLEAIDASYAVGYVEAIFRSSTNPTKGAIDIIKKFGKKSAKHWFKHASVHDLQDAKVYDFIRDRLAIAFRFKLVDFLTSTEFNENTGAFISYREPPERYIKVWG